MRAIGVKPAQRNDRLILKFGPPACLALLAVLASTTPTAADGFRQLYGSWSGSGHAAFTSGQKERLRCTARYDGTGEQLAIRLRCASAAVSIDLSGSLERAGRRVIGRWSEAGFGYSGSAFGASHGNGIRLRVSGDLNGSLHLTVSGERHTLTLASRDTSLTAVQVSMRRP